MIEPATIRYPSAAVARSEGAAVIRSPWSTANTSSTSPPVSICAALDINPVGSGSRRLQIEPRAQLAQLTVSTAAPAGAPPGSPPGRQVAPPARPAAEPGP